MVVHFWPNLSKKMDRVSKLFNRKQIADELTSIHASWMALCLTDGKSISVKSIKIEIKLRRLNSESS